MKVKDLLKEIQDNEFYYPDILEWDIALEQHPRYKDCPNCNKKEDSIIFNEPWCGKTLFIKSHAIGSFYFPKDKTVGIQIHY